MRRSTTSAATERPLLGLLLLVELIAAVAFIAWPVAAPPAPVAAAPAAMSAPGATTTPVTLPDSRTATVMAVGGGNTAGLTPRLGADLGGEAAAVTGFWGDDWPRHIDIVIAANDDEF